MGTFRPSCAWKRTDRGSTRGARDGSWVDLVADLAILPNQKDPKFPTMYSKQPQVFYQNRSTLICTKCFPGAILHQAPGTKFLKRSGPFDESFTTSVRAFQIFLAVSQSITWPPPLAANELSPKSKIKFCYNAYPPPPIPTAQERTGLIFWDTMLLSNRLTPSLCHPANPPHSPLREDAAAFLCSRSTIGTPCYTSTINDDGPASTVLVQSGSTPNSLK